MLCFYKVLYIYIYIKLLISKSILLKALSRVKLFIINKFKLLFHDCIYIYILNVFIMIIIIDHQKLNLFTSLQLNVHFYFVTFKKTFVFISPFTLRQPLLKSIIPTNYA